MASRDLLFEIGVEEMPSSACAQAVEQLRAIAPAMLTEAGLAFESVKIMATPRRLIVAVNGLAETGKETTLKVKGPNAAAAFDTAGNPTGAATGFARSQGVNPADLIKEQSGKGEYVFAVIKKPAPRAVDALPAILARLAAKLQFDKSMRWGGYDERFSRPVRWLLAIYGTETLHIETGTISSGSVTFGPRLSGSPEINIKNPADYFTKIKEAGITVDHAERKKLIEKQIAAAAKKAGGKTSVNPKVLDEVVFLVESPNAVAGTFDASFLSLPRAVIVTAMESHQRYFPVEDSNGMLISAFIVVHNGPASSADLIRAGHERVLRARLADALFFFDEDRKRALENRVDDLKGIVFQEKLGTIRDKAERVKELAAEIGEQLNYSDDEIAECGRAAMLAKTDLTTSMVREFPDLQGVIGGEYARLDGQPESVAAAIREQYLPKSFGDALPESKTGIAVSIADKTDTIVGCFGVGLIPTGSEDPYALRRQGQGVTSIILDEKLPLELEPLVARAVYRYGKQGAKLRPAGDILADFESFIAARLKFHFTTEGFRYDVAEAVLETEINDLVELEATARTLNDMVGTPVLDDVLTGFERCFNLSKGAPEALVDATLFVHDSEKLLLAAVETAEAAYETYLVSGDSAKYIKALAAMRPSIDKYFDDVLVMDKDEKVKANRLGLLKKCARLYLAVADFSKIVREGD